jgi:hypothetical protein
VRGWRISGDVGSTERQRGQSNGVVVFHRGGGSFYMARGGAPRR